MTTTTFDPTVGPLLAPEHLPGGNDAPRVDDVHAAAYTIPTEHPEADGTFAWGSTTIVVVHVRAGGVEGTGWTYGSTAIVDVVNTELRGVVLDADPTAIPAVWEAMVASVRNNMRAGVCGYAISALDIALWDLKARLLQCPLSQLWGQARREIPVYGSGGFTTFDTALLDEQLGLWVEQLGIPRVKIKIGESWAGRTGRDIARIHYARERIGPGAELFVDANGAYTAKEAIRVSAEVAGAGVTWIEEPVSSEDLAGLRRVRDCVTADVAAGEYGYDVSYFARLCSAVDCIQIDATRAGGYTAWHRIAALAAGHQLQVSAHCAPHLHAHCGVSTPNARHLEYFSDHARIEEMLFDGAVAPVRGQLRPRTEASGHGMQLRSSASEPYRVR